MKTLLQKQLVKGLTTLVVGLIFFGCAVGPNYKRPTVDAPDAFRRDEVGEAKSAEALVVDHVSRPRISQRGSARAAAARDPRRRSRR